MPEIIDISGNGVSEISEHILFGKYEIGKLLGCGAFAKVYHARNIQTSQSVAIKAISKQKIVKNGLTSNIKREISIMRELHHPYIVKLYEVLATRTKIYFVMEFVKGGELFKKIAKCRFSEDLSRRYFQQLISAVGYCHSHGVFHRDLKPENLLLDERGDLKVSDFGLSAVTSQIRNADGMLYTLCGTPAYVAPEILAKKGYNGAKVDIWSCGIILFVLNAGYLPFNDQNLMTMYRKIYKGEFRCPKWMSADLRRFLSRLLDTNPVTRITVDEIISDPWFKKGYKEIKVHHEHDSFGPFGLNNDNKSSVFIPPEKQDLDQDNGWNTFLNAFDIISFSSGFDLSGLFKDFDKSVEGERFVSAESPETITKRIEEVAMKENLKMRKKDWKLILEGQNGKSLVGVEMFQLTEKLVVVEVRSYDGLWRNKFNPELNSLVYRPELTGSGSSIS